MLDATVCAVILILAVSPYKLLTKTAPVFKCYSIGEVSERSKEHAWNACVVNATEGSNPSLSEKIGYGNGISGNSPKMAPSDI